MQPRLLSSRLGLTHPTPLTASSLLRSLEHAGAPSSNGASFPLPGPRSHAMSLLSSSLPGSMPAVGDAHVQRRFMSLRAYHSEGAASSYRRRGPHRGGAFPLGSGSHNTDAADALNATRQASAIYQDLLGKALDARDIEGAVYLLSSMIDSGVRPLARMFLRVIRATTEVGRIDLIDKLRGDMRRAGYPPNSFILSHMLFAYARAGCAPGVYTVFSELQRCGEALSDAVFQRLAYAFFCIEADDRALKILDMFRGAGGPAGILVEFLLTNVGASAPGRARSDAAQRAAMARRVSLRLLHHLIITPAPSTAEVDAFLSHCVEHKRFRLIFRALPYAKLVQTASPVVLERILYLLCTRPQMVQLGNGAFFSSAVAGRQGVEDSAGAALPPGLHMSLRDVWGAYLALEELAGGVPASPAFASELLSLHVPLLSVAFPQEFPAPANEVVGQEGGGQGGADSGSARPADGDQVDVVADEALAQHDSTAVSAMPALVHPEEDDIEDQINAAVAAAAGIRRPLSGSTGASAASAAPLAPVAVPAPTSAVLPSASTSAQCMPKDALSSGLLAPHLSADALPTVAPVPAAEIEAAWAAWHTAPSSASSSLPVPPLLLPQPATASSNSSDAALRALTATLRRVEEAVALETMSSGGLPSLSAAAGSIDADRAEAERSVRALGPLYGGLQGLPHLAPPDAAGADSGGYEGLDHLQPDGVGAVGVSGSASSGSSPSANGATSTSTSPAAAAEVDLIARYISGIFLHLDGMGHPLSDVCLLYVFNALACRRRTVAALQVAARLEQRGVKLPDAQPFDALATALLTGGFPRPQAQYLIRRLAASLLPPRLYSIYSYYLEGLQWTPLTELLPVRKEAPPVCHASDAPPPWGLGVAPSSSGNGPTAAVNDTEGVAPPSAASEETTASAANATNNNNNNGAPATTEAYSKPAGPPRSRLPSRPPFLWAILSPPPLDLPLPVFKRLAQEKMLADSRVDASTRERALAALRAGSRFVLDQPEARLSKAASAYGTPTGELGVPPAELEVPPETAGLQEGEEQEVEEEDDLDTGEVDAVGVDAAEEAESSEEALLELPPVVPQTNEARGAVQRSAVLQAAPAAASVSMADDSSSGFTVSEMSEEDEGSSSSSARRRGVRKAGKPAPAVATGAASLPPRRSASNSMTAAVAVPTPSDWSDTERFNSGASSTDDDSDAEPQLTAAKVVAGLRASRAAPSAPLFPAAGTGASSAARGAAGAPGSRARRV